MGRVSSVAVNPLTSLGDTLYGGAGTPTGYQNRALASLGASNTALGGTALGGINPVPGTNFAIDGDDTTHADSSGSLAVGTWWRVNLGGVFRIGRWRLVQGVGTTFGIATSYRIQSSSDDVTWTDRATVAGTGADGDSGYVNLAAPVTAQYWRVICDAGNFAGAPWHISTLAFDLVTTVGAGNQTRLPAPAARRVWSFNPDVSVPEWGALQAAVANVGPTVGVDVAAAGPAQVALKSELDATNTALNALLADLRAAGIIAP